MAVYKNLVVIGPHWVKETNSSLDIFTKQTIFDFLLTMVPPCSTTKFDVL